MMPNGDDHYISFEEEHFPAVEDALVAFFAQRKFRAFRDGLLKKSSELRHWWTAYQDREEERKERERESDKKDKVKKGALAKLTKAEKRALGL